MTNRGFTLLELMVASGIFAAVFLLGLGAIRNIATVGDQAHQIQLLGETGRAVLETVSREVRLANGGLSLGSDGVVEQKILPFTLLDQKASTGGLVEGSQLQIATTNTTNPNLPLVTLRQIRLRDVLGERFLETTVCQTLLCQNAESARLTPQGVTITNLAFRMLPATTTNRSPFVAISLTVEVPSATRGAAPLSETFQTTVTGRGYR